MVLQEKGSQQAFSGTCPACCGDLYLSGYSRGWSLRCLYCGHAFTEDSATRGAARRLMLERQEDAANRRPEVMSPRGG